MSGYLTVLMETGYLMLLMLLIKSSQLEKQTLFDSIAQEGKVCFYT